MKWFIPLVIVLVAACSDQPVALTDDNTVVALSSDDEPEPDECKSGKSENSAKSEKSEKSEASMKSEKSEASMKSGKSEASMKSGKSETCSPEEPPPPQSL